jgi:hypothetical protein
MLNGSRFLLALAFSIGSAYGQRKNVRSLSDAEVAFLQLVETDTTSNTVCLLPRAFNLGIQNPDTGRLLMLKQRRLNLILLEGTHRVYVLEAGRSQSLRRLDKTVFFGDNYESMPFLRKDTLHAYAGTGRWTRRDFITVFLKDEGGWEVMLRSNGLENRWVPHAYDAERDALYVLGSSSVRHSDWKSVYRDSAYRFDFNTRRWETLGTVDSEFPLNPRPFSRETLVAKTSLGDLYRDDGSFLLVDIVGNRTAVPNIAWADSLSRILGDAGPSARIHLKDTLHIIGTQESGIHRRIRFASEDLQPFREGSVYMSVKESDPTGPVWIATAASLLVAACSWLIMRRTRSANTDDRKNGSAESAILPTEPSEPSIGSPETLRQGLEEMRKHLSVMEWGLLNILARSTLAGRHLKTEDINKAIGVSHKEASLQKSRRSVVTGRINRVFTQCTGRSGELVVRVRDGDEKRRYNYRLDWETASLLADIGDD